MSDEVQRLIKMANQISENCFVNETEKIQFVQNHIQRFWSRSMKEALQNCSEDDKAKLEHAVLSAIANLDKASKR